MGSFVVNFKCEWKKTFFCNDSDRNIPTLVNLHGVITDNAYFRLRDGDAWIALDDTDKDNGCLLYGDTPDYTIPHTRYSKHTYSIWCPRVIFMTMTTIMTLSWNVVPVTSLFIHQILYTVLGRTLVYKRDGAIQDEDMVN
jgi:hypothetical protein